ncbi:sulfurtransferase TusC [Salinivibrio sp. SS3]|uniref:sulfurtransferase complex subunit TusC n=1 Tax=Salinivibrio TaxID=51366 RepID=UPI0008480282|nr:MULTISPECIES: sulfurtransferase complex subunit TusC [Salinivibrio]ODP97886.1 sulfurtransferase TusC [Salinivibrio sp. BNH]OOE65689.1 sulfurtransferase TusC [Salinivibrio kushneri]
MMKIGFVFSSAPHGSASGREGLDALLAASAFCDNLVVFFIGDGVFQLLEGQQPGQILSRDYIASFKMLPLCDVEAIYACQASLTARGLEQTSTVLSTQALSLEQIKTQLSGCDRILHF